MMCGQVKKLSEMTEFELLLEAIKIQEERLDKQEMMIDLLARKVEVLKHHDNKKWMEGMF